MKAGVLFFIISDIKDYLVNKGMLRDDGTCIFTNITNDVELTSIIEQSLKNHGVDIPDKVDKIVKALPLIISIFG